MRVVFPHFSRALCLAIIVAALTLCTVQAAVHGKFVKLEEPPKSAEERLAEAGRKLPHFKVPKLPKLRLKMPFADHHKDTVKEDVEKPSVSAEEQRAKAGHGLPHFKRPKLPKLDLKLPFGTTYNQKYETGENVVNFDLRRITAAGLDGVLEVAMDIGTLTDGTYCNLTSQKFRAMTQALGYSFIRVGGTEGDFTYYDMTDMSTDFPPTPPPAPFRRKLTGGVWDKFADFGQSVGARVVFGLNAGPYVRDATGAWTPWMAASLVLYNQLKYPGFVAGYEFGNEPNLYLANFLFMANGTQWAKDMSVVRSLLNSINPKLWSICCDITYVPFFGELSTMQQDFVKAAGFLYTNITTWHYYPLFGKDIDNLIPQWLDPYFATPERAAMPMTMDEAGKWADQFNLDVGEQLAPKWLGETASAVFGGQDGVSDVWVDSLSEIDRVGMITRRGHQKAFRQELCAHHWTNANGAPDGNTTSPAYALIDFELNPRPSYFVTLVFRRLVGDYAFQSMSTLDDGLRAYAYSGRNPSSIVVTLVNPGNVSRSEPQLCFYGISPTQLAHSYATLYELTSCGGGLQSRTVCNNGSPLTVDDTGLPSPIVGRDVPLRLVSPLLSCVTLRYPMEMPAQSMWFIQFNKLLD